MDRKTLIDFIPKPTNNDVIIYDLSLKNLIDENVFDEYNKLLPIYYETKKNYQYYKNNIEEYNKNLNGIYLYRTDWSEDDYLLNLQNAKKTYANLYGPIKRIESNIETLQKKIKLTDEKIQFQITKENKDFEDRKNNIDKKIDDNVDKLMSLKEIFSTLKIEKEKIAEAINENQEEFSLLKTMFENSQNGKCKCEFCGSLISRVGPDSNFYKRLNKKIEKNKSELEKLLQKKEKNDKQYELYEENIKNIKIELKNDSNFKSENFDFYRKKSSIVLRLEAQRDSMFENIEKLEKELRMNSETRSKQFLELKDKISQYELSLENLKRIKEIKNQINKEQDTFLKLKSELIPMYEKMQQYQKFISIFFKIYEQKLNEFCGKEFQFKLFNFDDFHLKEILIIYYNNVEYSLLPYKEKKVVDKILAKNFINYN